MITMDNSGSKLDRRDMSFPGRAQAQDKTKIVLTETSLVRMRHNRGVEQGCRFECILTGEERAEKEPAWFGNRLAIWDLRSHSFEMSQPTLIKIDMSLAEIRSN